LVLDVRSTHLVHVFVVHILNIFFLPVLVPVPSTCVYLRV
jgi:hypothetical protein